MLIITRDTVKKLKVQHTHTHTHELPHGRRAASLQNLLEPLKRRFLLLYIPVDRPHQPTMLSWTEAIASALFVWFLVLNTLSLCSAVSSLTALSTKRRIREALYAQKLFEQILLTRKSPRRISRHSLGACLPTLTLCLVYPWCVCCWVWMCQFIYCGLRKRLVFFLLGIS